ncbi:MAG: hypothetical protein CSA58_06720 [Micrococcales bacterium]|nr:MAG: hypothetical protein CSB46_07670 [Micrococcales bacterium]PIE26973.1 MAG: hypothetical protein CSA58_06720 [Micrococcales bacterium]
MTTSTTNSAAILRFSNLGVEERLAQVLLTIGVASIALAYATSGQSRVPWWVTTAEAIGFLIWVIFSERLGPRGAILGVCFVTVGLGFAEIFSTIIGLTVLAVTLPFPVAVVAVLSILPASIWRVAALEPSASLDNLILGSALSGILIYIFQRLAVTARQLRITQDELADAEVDAERDRLAHDLNAVVGQSINQVIHQVREARALLPPDSTRLLDEMAEIESLLQQGVQQLRDIPFEPVVNDFETELRGAQVLCRRLGVTLTESVDTVPDTVDQVFSLLLREAITNMFKHAEPTRCTIVARADAECIFSFTNDGVAEGEGFEHGTGLARHATAVRALGGTLDAGRLDGGRFRLTARIPSRTETTPVTAGLAGTQQPDAEFDRSNRE